MIHHGVVIGVGLTIERSGEHAGHRAVEAWCGHLIGVERNKHGQEHNQCGDKDSERRSGVQ